MHELINSAAICGTMAFRAASVAPTDRGNPSPKARKRDNALSQGSSHGKGSMTRPTRPAAPPHGSSRGCSFRWEWANTHVRSLLCLAPLHAASIGMIPTAKPKASKPPRTILIHSAAAADCSPKKAGGRRWAISLSRYGQRKRSSLTPRPFPATDHGWQESEPDQTGRSSGHPAIRRARGKPPTPAKKWHWINPLRSSALTSTMLRSSTSPAGIWPAAIRFRRAWAEKGLISL